MNQHVSLSASDASTPVAVAPPRISVAMAVYNNALYLAEAIESILAQTFTDFEFLIVDDGSTDGSGAIIDEYAACDPRIRAIHQPNRGLVASLNRLIAETRAPLIARMDGDDVALPERFARQLAFLDANPDYGVVGTRTRDIDAAGRLSPALDAHPLDHASFLAVLETGPWLCHPSVMMRTDLVRAAGGYRAAFRHCEDYDLWLRLSATTRLCSLPDRLLHYRRTEGQVSVAHAEEQLTGAAIAYLAHGERAAGRPDPIGDAQRLPTLAALDGIFGRLGVARAVRTRIVPNLVYAAGVLKGPGFGLILDHVREGGGRAGLLRTVARLVKLGEPARALRLLVALLAPKRS